MYTRPVAADPRVDGQDNNTLSQPVGRCERNRNVCVMILYFGCGYKRVECVHEFHSNDYLLLQWSGNTQTRFGLVGPIISAQQPFYYNSKLHFAGLCTSGSAAAE